MGKRLDLTGRRFERWKVADRADPIDNRSAWTCLCDCGSVKDIRAKTLLNGGSKSCGCLQKERAYQANISHGNTSKKSWSIEYTCWSGMIQRCTNPKNRSFERYGGRGIEVCTRWRTFENFLFDMGEKPEGNFSLERRDNDKGYCKRNCFWATDHQQRRNKRNNRNFSYAGVTMCLTDWAKRLGMSQSGLYGALVYRRETLEHVARRKGFGPQHFRRRHCRED